MFDGRAQGARFRISPLELCVSGFFCFASLVIIALCVTDYSITWMHPEVFLAERKHVLALTEIHWRDVARFFDCEALSDICAEARFLSYLTGYVNSFFRLWLVRYIPPHPSISITWLLSFASLYFFYRTIVLLTDDPPAALLGTGLYALSAGYLSSLLMLFNPAKALAGFFVNFCLFQATRVRRSPDHRAWSVAAVVLYLSLFLAYCSDQSCWFLCGGIPVLLVDWRQRRDWPFLACVVATFPLFLAFVTWAAPAIVKSLWGYTDFEFWSYVFNVGRAAKGVPFLERLNVRTLGAIAYNMLQSEFTWWRSGSTVAALSLLPLVTAILAAAGLASRQMRLLLARTALLLALFTCYESLLLTRHFVEAGTFYYGALFPNFALPMVAVAISCLRGARTDLGARAARAVACLAAIYLGYISFTWCMNFNRYWMGVHDRLYARTDLVPQDYGPLTLGAPLSEAKVAAYWRAARTGEDFRRLRPAFAPRDIWLFEKLDAWRRRQGLDP